MTERVDGTCLVGALCLCCCFQPISTLLISMSVARVIAKATVFEHTNTPKWHLAQFVKQPCLPIRCAPAGKMALAEPRSKRLGDGVGGCVRGWQAGRQSCSQSGRQAANQAVSQPANQAVVFLPVCWDPGIPSDIATAAPTGLLSSLNFP